MADLKPCPFCGGKARLEHNARFGVSGSSVCCPKCNIEGEWFGMSFRFAADDEAIAAWNRRVKEGDNNG